MVKKCDLGLENAALGKCFGLGQYFQDLAHSFSPYGPPSRQITYISVIPHELRFFRTLRLHTISKVLSSAK